MEEQKRGKPSLDCSSGPMVYGITYCPESRSEELRKLGCADSKTLNEEQRDRLFGKLDALKDLVGWAVEIIAPGAICDSMFKRQKYSLNEVSYDSAIGLVRRALSLNVNVTSVFVDTVGPPDKYQAKLTALFPGIAFTVAKKADATYPVVSAASIFAKVTRDEVLKNWQFREPSFAALNSGAEKLNWGSGYPAGSRSVSTVASALFRFDFVRLSVKVLEKKTLLVFYFSRESTFASLFHRFSCRLNLALFGSWSVELGYIHVLT